MNAQDLEAVWNRIAISQARTNKLVESWLPPVTSSSEQSTSNSNSNENDDEALKAELATEAYSDTAGVGYRPAISSLGEGSTPKRALTSNERLRSLLLGSQAGRGKVPPSSRPTETLMGSDSTLVQQRAKEKATAAQNPLAVASGSKQTLTRKEESSDEEELGRSAIGRKRKTRS